jgi:hypothetical protein
MPGSVENGGPGAGKRLPADDGPIRSADACRKAEAMNGAEPNPATPSTNPRTPQGARSRGWQKLQSAGDVQRFLRFLILETKAGRIDVKKSAVLGQLACYLLRAVETADLEERICRLEGEQDVQGDRGVRIVVEARRHESV